MTEEIFKLENQICFPLYAASRLVTKLYQPALAAHDITYPQYLVFLLLWEKDPRTVSELSKCLFLDSNTLTPLLKRLEAKKLINRKRSDEDERVVEIFLTPAGRGLKEKLRHLPLDILHSVQAEELNMQEVHQLKQTLHKLISALG